MIAMLMKRSRLMCEGSSVASSASRTRSSPSNSCQRGICATALVWVSGCTTVLHDFHAWNFGRVLAGANRSVDQFEDQRSHVGVLGEVIERGGVILDLRDVDGFQS